MRRMLRADWTAYPMTTIQGWKLFRVRRDGSLGSLFINRNAVLPVGVWMQAGDHPTKGYAHRPYWHAGQEPNAPHLSLTGRIWLQVELRDVKKFIRPICQGGVWFLAGWLRILPREEINNQQKEQTHGQQTEGRVS